ncbi:MAG: NTP transferase domain-containing protein [Clostridia bacterium]|nr:NTP transferase domain-containing protein [Clostridia bacterium]
MVTAIVLAGGSKPCLNEGRLMVKESLVPIGDRYMVEYVVEALQNSTCIETIVISDSTQELKDLYKDSSCVKFSESGFTSVDSFLNAIHVLPPETKQILVVTADIPLLIPEAVEHFINTCQGIKGDLYYPIISREVNEKSYPGVQRTYVHLKEGVFTGGNIFLINTEIVSKCIGEVEELVRLRKKPLSLASCLGWRLLLAYIFRRLSLDDAERGVSRLLGGIKGVGVISPYAEIGIDVDKESDIILVKKKLCG